VAKPRYQGAHRAIRRAGLPYAYGTPCCRCGKPMVWPQRLELDHNDDGVGYRGWAHAWCNRSAGGKLAKLGRRSIVHSMLNNATRTCLGVEVSWDRHHSAVAAAWQDGETVRGALVAYLDGTDTVVERVAALCERYDVRHVVIDPGSPASTLIDQLRQPRGMGRRLVEPTTRDVSVATGQMQDAMLTGTVKLEPSPVLEAACRHATPRQLAGAIAYDRRVGGVDGAPLLAAMWAHWQARQPRRVPSIH
jgi:hypothetical protein